MNHVELLNGTEIDGIKVILFIISSDRVSSVSEANDPDVLAKNGEEESLPPKRIHSSGTREFLLNLRRSNIQWGEGVYYTI